MLERTAGCLESGTLRRLLPASKKSTKSRRTLHSGFWTHGALDLEFSPLWTALVRASDPVELQEDARVPQKKSGMQQTMLLDFLYPAGTLNFLRSYSGWWVERQDGRFSRGGIGKIGHRQYSSATDVSSNKKSLGLDAVRYIPGDESIEESVAFLCEKLILTRSYDYEDAWRKFMQLEGVDQQGLRKALIHYLRESDRIVDAERTTELFDMLDEGQRDADAHQWAIRAYLKLRNLSDAMQLRKNAIQNLGVPAGSEELLAHLVKSSSWGRALSLYDEVRDLEAKSDASYLNLDIVLDRIPNLPIFAKDLADFANRKIELSSKDPSSTSNLLAFASRIIQRAIVKPEGFDRTNFLALLKTLQKWETHSPKTYEGVFTMLANLNETKLLVQCYRYARRLKNVKFNPGTLSAVLKIFCAYHSVLGMKEVLDDYFKMHGAPTRHAYKLCMIEFASQGDAQTVHALCDQFIARFSGTSSFSADDLTPLLQVHAKRGELREVVNTFHRINSTYGLQPTIMCYNILLNAYGKVQDFDMAMATFEDILMNPSLLPDGYTLGTMLGICSTRGDIDLTRDIYKMVEELNINPSMAMVDALVHCYCQDRQLDRAEEHCEAALGMDFKGSKTRMWNYVLVGYAMQHDIINVNRVLKRMIEARVEYDKYTYSALMQALCMVKQPQRAYSILKNVMPEAGITATHFHYAIVMGGFIATGQLQKVFAVHNRLERRSIQRSASTSLFLMKGLAEQAHASHDRPKEPIDYKQALDLFQRVMNSADAREISSTTRKGAMGLPVDIAYPAMFYGYVMFILGQNAEFKTADALYEAFKTLLPRSSQSQPPSNILGAFMASKLREGNHKAVHEGWRLALSEAKKTGTGLPSIRIDAARSEGYGTLEPPTVVRIVTGERAETNKVLRVHQLNLGKHLDIYMRSLAMQNQQHELMKTVDEFQLDGFELDGHNWNTYIALLASKFSLRLAFQLCETKLMPGWSGWARLRRKLPERNRLPLELRRRRKDRRYLRPKYHTLLWLARGYLRIEAQSAEDRAAEAMLDWVGRECPKTLNVLRDMQRTDEEFEREILQQ